MTKTEAERIKAMTPMEAIRARCVDCSAGEYSRVTNCKVSKCVLYPYRHGRIPENRMGIKSPLKTIRARCLQCNGTTNEVKLCQVFDCELFQYRDGHNPRRKGVGNKTPFLPPTRELGVNQENDGVATMTRPDDDPEKHNGSPPVANQGGHPGVEVSK